MSSMRNFLDAAKSRKTTSETLAQSTAYNQIRGNLFPFYLCILISYLFSYAMREVLLRSIPMLWTNVPFLINVFSSLSSSGIITQNYSSGRYIPDRQLNRSRTLSHVHFRPLVTWYQLRFGGEEQSSSNRNLLITLDLIESS